MRKPKTARAVHANRGVEARYRKQLDALIAEMVSSCEYWLKAAYNADPPRMAEDAEKLSMRQRRDAWLSKYGPTSNVKKTLKELRARWLLKFEESAPLIAQAYLTSMFKTSDAAFKAALKDAGWTVDFKLTPTVRDAFTASLEENVSLIKSIPEQYLQKVEGVVMRAYSNGRDQAAMVKGIRELHPVTAQRAALIARDQSNKANAVINRARQMELGITEAIWMHSHAGKTPRPSHVAANGKRYRIAEGCLIDGEYIQPGEEINCRCTSRPVLPK